MTAQLELQEHRSKRVPARLLSQEAGEALHRSFGKYVDVEFPSPRTGYEWSLTSKGWVGTIVAGNTAITIRPKLPVANIARMLWLAYDLPMETYAGMASCTALRELYEQLVRALLERVRRLLRQGIHHRYQAMEEELPVVRGRIVIPQQLRRPANLRVPCRFDVRTADISENRVLAWTLERLLRGALVRPELRSELRATYRQLVAVVTAQEVRATDILRIRYDRLTERYRQAHTICRLLLDSSAPTPERGDEDVVPFLINMPQLFESFVSRWLSRHLPHDLEVKAQERSAVGEFDRVEFYIDLVIYERSGPALCVLDTKYKDIDAPIAQDVAQVGYYALLKGCPLAGLVLPVPTSREWQGASGVVRTFRTTFDLSADMEVAGHQFLKDLMQRLTVVREALRAGAPRTTDGSSPRFAGLRGEL